jgi:hypothetical protein
MFKVFLAAALAVGAGGLTYSAAEVASATETPDTESGFVVSDDEGNFDGDKGKGGKGGFKGGKKGKGGKGKGGKGKGGPKGGKGPQGEE